MEGLPAAPRYTLVYVLVFACEKSISIHGFHVITSMLHCHNIRTSMYSADYSERKKRLYMRIFCILALPIVGYFFLSVNDFVLLFFFLSIHFRLLFFFVDSFRFQLWFPARENFILSFFSLLFSFLLFFYLFVSFFLFFLCFSILSISVFEYDYLCTDFKLFFFFSFLSFSFLLFF